MFITAEKNIRYHAIYISGDRVIPRHGDVIGLETVAMSDMSLFITDTTWEKSISKYHEHAHIIIN